MRGYEEPVVFDALLCGDGNPWPALVGPFLASAVEDSIPSPVLCPHDACAHGLRPKRQTYMGLLQLLTPNL